MAPRTTAAANAVATRKAASAPAPVHDYGDYAQYDDRPTSDELLIPLLSILQPMSPQVTEETVPGAKAGLFFNTVTGELLEPEPGLPFQPVFFEHMFVEWVPREQGGGIAGRYDVNDPFIAELKAGNNNSVVGLKNGINDVLETYYVYGNMLSADGTEVEGFAVLPAKSTSIKPVRAWRTAMQMVKGTAGIPSFAFRSRLSNTKQKNDSGTWWQLKATPYNGSWKESLINPATEGHLLEAGRALLEMIKSGRAKADTSHEEQAGSTAGEAAPF